VNRVSLKLITATDESRLILAKALLVKTEIFFFCSNVNLHFVSGVTTSSEMASLRKENKKQSVNFISFSFNLSLDIFHKQLDYFEEC
jgi:hypothetical protein